MKKRNPFYFKKFIIQHEQVALPVTTDACIFGAVITQKIQSNSAPHNILDLGTGTGVLLHFIHQIYPDTEITGIEKDIPSFQTAIHNFSANNIQHAQIINNDFFIWGKSTIQKFDLIVSNPPFFENQLESVNAQKRQARHFSDQGFADFFHLISSLLTSIGKAWLMLPYTPLYEINPSVELEKNFDHWKNHATSNKLLIQDFITVKANESKKPHIVFIQLSRETTSDITGSKQTNKSTLTDSSNPKGEAISTNNSTTFQQLIVYQKNRQYTKECFDLLNPFINFDTFGKQYL